MNRECFKVAFDHYITLTVVIFSGNKNWPFWPKKIAAHLFCSFYDHQYFFDETLTNRANSARFDFVNVLWISNDGEWNKNKFSTILKISKNLKFECFWISLYAFPFPIWILAFDNDVIKRLHNHIKICILFPRAPSQS